MVTVQQLYRYTIHSIPSSELLHKSFLLNVFYILFLFIKVCLKYPLRCSHSEHTKVKIILHHSDMILEDHIILKLGKQNIASVLFALNLVTDISYTSAPEISRDSRTL